MTFRDVGEQSESICYRDVTSPINELDGQSNSSRGERCPGGGNASQENGATDLIRGKARTHFHQTLSHCASSTDDSPFFDNDMPTMRSSSSSEGLPQVVGLNWEGSVESNEVRKKGGRGSVTRFKVDVAVTKSIRLHQDSDQCKKSSSRRAGKGHHSKSKSRHGSSNAAHASGLMNCGMLSPGGLPPSYTGPKVCPGLVASLAFPLDWSGFLTWRKTLWFL